MIKKRLLAVCLMASQMATADIYQLHENPDVEAAIQGNYPRVQRESLPLGDIQKQWSLAKKTDGITLVDYSKDKVVQVLTRAYMSTELMFPDWENINLKNIVVGDRENFQVSVVAPNLVSIAPLLSGVDSSLKILGDSGWLYTFYIVSHARNSKQIPDLAVYLNVPGPKFPRNGQGFVRPHLNGQEATDKKMPDYLEDIQFDASNIDFQFTMFGDKAIAPERIYSDGQITVLDFGKKRLKKQYFSRIVAVSDGVDTPIDFHLKDGKVQVLYHGPMALEHGEKRVCIYPSNQIPKAVSKKSKKVAP